MPFISYSYLIAVDSISNAMLNRSGKNGHPYLVPEFRRKAFSFSLLSSLLLRRRDIKGGGPPLSSHNSLSLHFVVFQPFPLIHWPLGKAFLLWGLPFST